ncbi:extracellular solute-binding protein [Paenibacillus mendelii]|uniref:Extracellular solute-binding protein n=1 Tax=Paenibacillus mendelii TaxID=206163 RepID=A0ABV6JPB3_9BACL|nr:extracellular solute-binding protein [Paenibacillus mendelii]MCQ6562333.1 extracellular solute-binding protein [Paenibacillus mendelii]
MKRLWGNRLQPVMIAMLATIMIAGCGGGNNDSPKGDDAAAKGNNQGSTAKGSEQTKLKVYVPSNVEEFPSGTNLNKNEIVDYIKEKTGFDIEWEMQPKESVDQKINIMMASGDTPDLIITGSKSIYANLAQQGLLAPLDEALNENGPRIMETVPADTWKAVTYNDSIYAIAVPQNQSSTMGMLVRTDILEELGIPIPKTLDEYSAALKTIHEKKSAGGLIPLLGGAADGNGDAFGYIQSFSGAFGLGAQYVVEGDKVVHTTTQPAAKEYLSYMSKLYADGILDREFPVNKNPNIQEKLVSGQAAMATVGWADAKGIIEAFKEKNPNGKLELIHPPVGADGQYGYQKNTPVRVYMLIPKASTKVKEVVQFINNYMAEDILNVVSYGWEGKHYNMKDGMVVATEEAENIRYRIYYQLWDTEKNFLNRVALKGFSPYYDPLKEYPTYTEITNYAPPIPEVEENSQALLDLTNEYFIKIITGALPLDAFDEYVSKWNSLGGEASLKAINEWYQTFK